jgi:hypothetical protein
MNELGLFAEYGNLIISVVLIVYMSLYAYLTNEYGCIDEID